TTKSIYLVAIQDEKVVGGCGIASFNNDENICELRKLFLLKEGRGQGLGQKIVEECLEFAKQQGYKKCYLDTLSNMESAIRLYEKLDFERLSKPLEGVIHTGCDVWMIKEI
ncbi:MAG: GNAT family N-acetyltransferase, partial [Psychrilyobacter sp.]|nr:GNAT family N-acetyltransferase [Psychrilyobacter sp.]